MLGSLGYLVQLVHLVPPAVGLLLVLRMRTTQRWRTWAILAFSLGVLTGLASFVLTLVVINAWGMRGALLDVYSTAQGLLALASLAAGGLGVAAVVADRREEAAPVPGTLPYPSSPQP